MTRRGYTNGIFAISIAMMIYYTDAVKTITLDSYSCNDKVYDLDHGDSIEIKWEGLSLPSYCRLGVEAPDTSSSTCINIEKFRIYGCVFQIQLYKEDSEFPTHTYDCSSADIDDEYCIEEQRITLLKFTYNSTGSISFRPNVRLTVKVDAMEATATEEGGIAGIVVIVIIFLCCVGGCGALVKNGAECVCELLRELCSSLSDLLSRLCECTGDCVSNSSSNAREPAHDTDIAIAPEPEPEATINLSRGSSMVSLNIDMIEIPEEPLDPSAPPMDNSFAPPPYIAPPPSVPSGAAVPDAPPPSYYDVVTMNKFEPPEKH